MTTKRSDKQVSDYLLGSMSETDRDTFEERLLSDEELYYEVVEAENDLIDRFAAGELKGAERLLFENSIDMFPTRTQRLVNARVLRSFIADHKHLVSPDAVIFTKVFELFRSQFATPAYAMAGMILVLAASLAMLFSMNRDREAQIAKLQAELENVSRIDPNPELADSRRRIEELQSEIDSERDATGDLSGDLANEREARQRLEREIAQLKNSTTPRPVKTGEDHSVTVMRLDETPGPESMLPDVSERPERLSILISLSGAVEKDERVSIRLNGQEIARNVAVRSTERGLEVNATVMTNRLSAGPNIVTVHDTDGNEVARYSIGEGSKGRQE